MTMFRWVSISLSQTVCVRVHVNRHYVMISFELFITYRSLKGQVSPW